MKNKKVIQLYYVPHRILNGKMSMKSLLNCDSQKKSSNQTP